MADTVIGGIQAAAVLAAPLPTVPAYFKGREDGPAEWAEVAERGPELIHRKATGRYHYQAERGIVALGQGDRVLTAEHTTRVLSEVNVHHLQAAQQPARLAAAFSGAAQAAQVSRETASNKGYDELAQNIKANTEALGKIKPVNVNVHRGSDADVETSQSLTRYWTQRRFGK